MKPIFRWTIGDTRPEGIDVFKDAVWQTQRALGVNTFDWVVCSNAKQNKATIKQIAHRFNLKFHEPSWDEFPQILAKFVPSIYDINADAGSPSGRQGSFWKFCPPRLNKNVHEIIADNDLIICKPIAEIEQFLSDNKTLLLEEDVHCHGKYYHHFNDKEKYNSGLLGMPPNLDFEAKIIDTWLCHGKYQKLLSRDEQGLLTLALKQCPHIVIPNTTIIQLMASGKPYDCKYAITEETNTTTQIITSMTCKEYTFNHKEKGFHFCQINREPHAPWMQYSSLKLL